LSPDDRPTFVQVVETLHNILNELDSANAMVATAMVVTAPAPLSVEPMVFVEPDMEALKMNNVSSKEQIKEIKAEITAEKDEAQIQEDQLNAELEEMEKLERELQEEEKRQQINEEKQELREEKKEIKEEKKEIKEEKKEIREEKKEIKKQEKREIREERKEEKVSAALAAPSKKVEENEIDGVFFRAERTAGPSGTPEFVYHVRNERDYDVKVILELSGSNSRLSPLNEGQTVAENKIVEAILRKGKNTQLASVQVIDKVQPSEHSLALQVERCDVQQFREDIAGVILFTEVDHGYTRQVTFEVENQRDFDVVINLKVQGTFLSMTCDLPAVKQIPAKTKLYVATLKSSISSNLNWEMGWSQVVKKSEKMQVLKGVQLMRRQVGNTRYEIELTNGRRRPVLVTITGIKPTPVEVEVKPTETMIAVEYEQIGKVDLEWEWRELS